ncbi:MAG: GatB/YqeY domain-containing protein [Bacilli bacterium]|nr:GatB/YqeY domain-containing protein [Bacilli bacterium]
MREKILKDLVGAMKAKDKNRLSVLRMVKGAMQLEELDKKKELTDTEMAVLVGKQIKTRKDSIEEFKKGNREDLIEQTQSEITVLEEYMPEQMSKEDITKKVEEVFELVKPEGQKDIGKIMKELASLKGKADMAFVNQIVKEKLN